MGVTGQSLMLRNVTITANQAINSGGGIYMDNTEGGQILMANSILAGNSAADRIRLLWSSHLPRL